MTRIQQKIKRKRAKWTRDQHIRYLYFISGHSIIFQQKKIEKVIFKEMADFIGTKNEIECYSLHDRMKQRHHSYKKIVQNLRDNLKMEQKEIDIQAQKIIIQRQNNWKQIYKQIASKPLFQQVHLEAQNHQSTINKIDQKQKITSIQQPDVFENFNTCMVSNLSPINIEVRKVINDKTKFSLQVIFKEEMIFQLKKSS